MNFERTKHFDRLTLDNLKNHRPSQIPNVLQEATDYFEELTRQHCQTKNNLLLSLVFDRTTKPYLLIRSRSPVLLVDMVPTNTSILVALGNKLGKFYDAIGVRTKSQDIILDDNTAIKMYLVATVDDRSTYEPGDLVSVDRYNGRLIHLKKRRFAANTPNPQRKSHFAGDAT